MDAVDAGRGLSATVRPALYSLASLDHLLLARKEKHMSRCSTLSAASTLVSCPVDTIACTPKYSLDNIGPTQPPTNSTQIPIGSTQSHLFHRKTHFRTIFAEIGFVTSLCLSLLLNEYLISGFTGVWPVLQVELDDQTPFDLWPAALLSLIQCSVILPFARLSDMYGGYSVFMFGLFWLAIWTLTAGFSKSLVLLDICRAMQGLAVAALTASFMPLISQAYAIGPRRNRILGIYGACAPIGFYLGISVSAALPETRISWFSWIASSLAALAFVLGYLCVPMDMTDRKSLDLKMDWMGTLAITSGLILVNYSLSASTEGTKTSWKGANVLGPFLVGICCLILFVYIEGWKAECPLLPLSFFKPKGTRPLLLASLFLYSCFGIWLYTTTSFLEDQWHVGRMSLAVWFLPLLVGGVFISTFASALLHFVPIFPMLCLSGLAFVAAPLLLAFANEQSGYWPFVFPAMVCGTFGIDLLYTIMNVFLSSAQPVRFQGLAGAVSSLAVNLAIAFGLNFAQIVENHAFLPGDGLREGYKDVRQRLKRASDAAFFFAAGSAAVGVVLIVFFVRMRRTIRPAESLIHDQSRLTDVEQGVASSAVSNSDATR